mmetsp:Transcript_71041/g.196174  ORF Transcript_71041/g.196174 Transcript_71041/m.196174 type:complete len:284 (+) Transcript_71041:562-1413(+)
MAVSHQGTGARLLLIGLLLLLGHDDHGVVGLQRELLEVLPASRVPNTMLERQVLQVGVPHSAVLAEPLLPGALLHQRHQGERRTRFHSRLQLVDHVPQVPAPTADQDVLGPPAGSRPGVRVGPLRVGEEGAIRPGAVGVVVLRQHHDAVAGLEPAAARRIHLQPAVAADQAARHRGSEAEGGLAEGTARQHRPLLYVEVGPAEANNGLEDARQPLLARALDEQLAGHVMPDNDFGLLAAQRLDQRHAVDVRQLNHSVLPALRCLAIPLHLLQLGRWRGQEVLA